MPHYDNEITGPDNQVDSEITTSGEPLGALMDKVIVYRYQLLPPSQTFIRQQVLALTRWQPVLVGEQLAENGLSLDGLETLLLRDRNLRLADLAYRVSRSLHLPHLPTVRQLRRVGARLVHVHFGTDAVDIWPWVRALRLPMLVTLHGYDINIHRRWWESGAGGWRRRSYPRRLLKLALEPNVHFIAVSEAVRRRAVEYGIPDGKIAVRHIGVDTDFFRPVDPPIQQRRRRVVFVGRLVQNKGADLLIRAFAEARKTVEDAELAIIGDGPLRESLETLSRTLNVPVDFLGLASPAEVAKQLGTARVLCQPSVTITNGESEGFGLVILEAQASGVPVISSAHGAVEEGMLPGKTGLRIHEGDIDSMSSGLVRLLQDERLLMAMSAEAVSFARRNFNLRACTAALEESYDAIASRAHDPRS